MIEGAEFLPAGQAYRRLLQFARPYWTGFVVAVLGMALVAATESGFAALMKPMLDGSFVEKDPEIIRLVPIALLGIFLVRGIGSFLSSYCMTWIGRNVIRDLRSTIFNQLLCLSSSFYDQTTKGNLTSKLIYDVEQVANATTNAITIVIRDSLTVLGLLIWMLYLSWKLSLFFLFIVPVMGLIVMAISDRFRRISRRIQSSMGNVTQTTQQVVEGNRVVKIYGAEQQERLHFSEANNYNRRQNMRLALTSAISVPVSQFFGAFALAGVLYFATQESMLQAMTPGTFMSFVAASMLLLAPLKRLTQVTQSLQQGVAASQSIFQLLDQPQELDAGAVEKEHVQGIVEFRDVNFRYTNSEQQVLCDINLKAEAGTTVAIVGRSGSGKSTLVSLIPRFYDFGSGEILLDGVPVQDYKLANLRQHLAMVSQDITLFNDTIRNNIAYGVSCDADMERIVAAAKAAHALDFIEALPNGFDTEVGDQGALLSGGQRQRLSIARAILKDAPVLILDEATSALDTESERAIQAAFESLMHNRTTFVIAHRLSTIEKADIILVMHDGKIVERGTHGQLLNAGGHYSALHSLQFQQSDAGSTS